MIFDYSLAGLVVAGLLIYLTTPSCGPSGSEGRAMIIDSPIKIAALLRLLPPSIIRAKCRSAISRSSAR